MLAKIVNLLKPIKKPAKLLPITCLFRLRTGLPLSSSMVLLLFLNVPDLNQNKKKLGGPTEFVHVIHSLP